MRLTGTLFSVLVLAPQAGHSQVRGIVTDQTGRPLQGAMVALWSRGAEVARALSNEAGRFRLAAESSALADAIVARAIGFQPLSLKWTTSDSVVTLQLSAAPVPLPELMAVLIKVRCPSRDDPEARRLWQIVRKKYDLSPMWVGLAVRVSFAQGSAYQDELGHVNESRHQPATMGLHGSARDAGYQALRSDGYARSRRSPNGELSPDPLGTHFEWWYPSFHRWQPDHFVQEAFGQLQNFGVSETTGTKGIVFCSRLRDRPYLSGAILLDTDSTISEAMWRFHTPKPDEQAGGHAWYLPLRGGRDAPHFLLPVQSAFWRARGGAKGLYFHESAAYHGWYFGTGVEPPAIAPPR
ncbi:MAG: carboxypeptidase regulatory-like domain-containing protein [Gemmatimonadales bacterium]|nr:carboxypeptidase regulatory-like domain-containing protein [Gemmatimonadales bacterium]